MDSFYLDLNKIENKRIRNLIVKQLKSTCKIEKQRIRNLIVKQLK